MKRLLTSLLVASVTLTGCAPHVDIPPDDATPDAVATAFLESVRVGDQQAAQHLSGDCWNTTQAWFNRNKKKITTFTVESIGKWEITPTTTNLLIGFKYELKSGENTSIGWNLDVTRIADGQPWRVCNIRKTSP